MRATGHEAAAPAEIIPIIDDDGDAFGDQTTSRRGTVHGTVHDTGGRRWVGPVAAAALIGLIGYGLATSGSSSGTPSAAPVTSTSVARSTTTVPPTTTLPPPPVPYYAADPPREFTIRYAAIEQVTQPYIDDGSYQLWATPGSSATTGSWFAIEMFSGQATTENAMRMQIGDRSIAVAHTSGGQTVAVARTPPGPIVTLTAFGWSVERLAQLAVTIDSDRGDVVFGDPALLGAHRLVTTRPLWIAMQGWPAEYIYYSPSWVDDGFSISIAETHTADDGGNGIDREAALRFGLDHATPFEVDGHSAVAGTTVGLYPQPMATWVDGDSIVTVSGALPIPRLISLARTVHRVEKTEWDGMQLQVKQSSSLDGPSFEVGVGNPVSFGTDANGDVWTVTVSANPFGGRWQIVWGPGSGWLSADAPTIATLVDTRRTYVLADLPRAVAATAELHVLRDGMEPVVVPFLDPDPTVDRTFAAYAFSEAVGYTAQIVAPDGAVLATWPSP